VCRLSYQDRPLGIGGRQSGARTDFSSSVIVVPFQPSLECFLLIHLSPVVFLKKTYLRAVELFRPFRWSRGSVLAFGTQVRGFKPGRSRRIFKGEKILSTPSFGGEVKPSVPCRRFAACKRSLELRVSRILGEICRNISRPRRVPPSAAGSCVVGREGT